MSQLIQQLRLLPTRSTLLQFQRFRGKINIQRPRKPHYERAKILAVTQPAYPEPVKTKECFQPVQKKEQIENPYNEVIAREVRNWLQHSRMVGIFHLNSVKQDELFEVRVKLHQQNMHLKSYGYKIMEKAIINTEYEAILPLFESNRHCLVFSSEQRVGQMLRITRRVPYLQLLAGIVDERLLSRNEFVAYAQLPSLPMAQAELAQTLNMAASNLVRQLETHQNNFVNVLDVYAKGAQSDEVATTDTSKENDTSSTQSESVSSTSEEEKKT